MAKTKFSLIIPTFSGEKYIGQVFDSILPQIVMYDAEVIVVIDGPNNTLESIIEKYKRI